MKARTGRRTLNLRGLRRTAGAGRTGYEFAGELGGFGANGAGKASTGIGRAEATGRAGRTGLAGRTGAGTTGTQGGGFNQ